MLTIEKYYGCYSYPMSNTYKINQSRSVMLLSKKVKLLAITMIFMFAIPVGISAETLADETINIGAFEFKSYNFSVSEDNADITVSVDVTSGNDVSVLVIDQENLDRLTSGQSGEAYINKQNVVSGEFDATLGPAATYYVFFDNLDSLSGVTVHLVIEVVTQSSQIIGAIVIIGLIVLGVWLWRRRS